MKDKTLKIILITLSVLGLIYTFIGCEKPSIDDVTCYNEHSYTLQEHEYNKLTGEQYKVGNPTMQPWSNITIIYYNNIGDSSPWTCINTNNCNLQRRYTLTDIKHRETCQ